MSGSASVSLWGKQAVAAYALSYFNFGQNFGNGFWASPTKGRTLIVSGGYPFPGGLDYQDASVGFDVTAGWAMKPTLSLLGSTRLLQISGGFGPQTGLSCIIQSRWIDFPGEQTLYTAWGTTGVSGGPSTLPLGHVGKLVNGQYVYSQMAYANSPVAIRGDAVTLYRNGVQIMSATNPTPQQGVDATSLNGGPRDGSYLVVSEAVDSIVQADGGQQALLKDFSSFVISSTRPAVAIVPPDDDFGDDRWDDVRFFRGRLFSSNQILSYDELYGSPHQFNWWNAQTNQAVPQSSGVGLKNLPVGTYTLTIENYATLKDVFGNLPLSPPTVTWTKHAVPANERFGARPELVGPPKGHDARPILPQQSPVESVDLVFDREVLASSVSVGQFSFFVNGQSVGVAGILQETPLRWKVFLPVGAQQPNTKCELSYNPSGTVTDDIKVVRFASQAVFPLASASKYLTAYVSEQDGKWFSKSPSGYVEIEPNSPPLDRFGVPYGPEPCVLVARTAWVMALAEPVPRRIDLTASFSPYFIGEIVSVEGMASPNTTASDEIGVSFTTPIGLGYYPKPQESCKCASEYLPGVPLTGQGQGEWSWFGLETTIDPAPPKTLSSISVPKAPQRHSSAIRSAQNISGFTITGPGGTNLLAQAAASGIEVSMTLDGDLLPQNRWRCLTSGSGSETLSTGLEPGSNGVKRIDNIDRVYAIVIARRGHRQYKSLGTTVLGKLGLLVEVRVWVRQDRWTVTSSGGNTGGFGQTGGGTTITETPQPSVYYERFLRADVDIQPSQELALASGTAIPFSFPQSANAQEPVGVLTGWTIQAITN
jgi:hypothetical protein